MHGHINIKSPNNTRKWQMGFNTAIQGLKMNGASPPFLYVPYWIGTLLIDVYTVNLATLHGTINMPRFAGVLSVMRAVQLTILGRGQRVCGPFIWIILYIY
jgi:hypothetical protein